MITEKAFPENETVITGAINAHGSPGIGSTVIYERRIGATAMMEAIVPFDFTRDDGSWGTAFGDLALGYKQTLVHSVGKGSIFSVGGELIVPTGDRGRQRRRLDGVRDLRGVRAAAAGDVSSGAYRLRTAGAP